MDNRNRTFKFSISINGCEQVFDKGLDPGVISQGEVEFSPTRKDKEYSDIDFVRAIMDKSTDLINETITVNVVEVDNNGNVIGKEWKTN